MHICAPKTTIKVKGAIEEGPSKPQPKGTESILLGYYTSPGGILDCKEAIVVPIEDFVRNKANFRIVKPVMFIFMMSNSLSRIYVSNSN